MKALKRTGKFAWIAVLIAAILGLTWTGQVPANEPDLDKVAGLIMAERYAEAVIDLKKIITNEPGNSQAWLLSGMAYNRLGRFVRSARCLAAAGSLGATGPVLQREKGISLWGRGKYRAAFLTLAPAAGQDPTAAYVCGLACQGLGLTEEAARWFNLAAKNPGMIPFVAEAVSAWSVSN